MDVAHTLAKDMSEPLRSKPTIADDLTPVDGLDPLFDRDQVHEIYAEWRRVFDDYGPPRTAVAEAWVPASRRAATTRYGLPPGTDYAAWLLSEDTEPVLDHVTGLRRARAATLLMLALPGSAYLYQGEELGLFEVADLPTEALQDPIWQRTGHRRKGRDGCRVPLPWTRTGASFGFGERGAHLPQPDWFGALSVQAQDGAAGSTLELYRQALRTRQQLQDAEELKWVCGTQTDVVHFQRPGGWQSITNFGTQPVELPAGTPVLTSGPTPEGRLPADTTAWLVETPGRT